MLLLGRSKHTHKKKKNSKEHFFCLGELTFTFCLQGLVDSVHTGVLTNHRGGGSFFSPIHACIPSTSFCFSFFYLSFFFLCIFFIGSFLPNFLFLFFFLFFFFYTFLLSFSHGLRTLLFLPCMELLNL